MIRPSTPPGQGALFDEIAPATDTTALVTVTASRAPLTRVQKTFNRLTGKIRRQREELSGWEAYMPRFEQRARTELDAAEQEVREHQRRLVKRLDALFSGRKAGDRLAKRYRARVRMQIIELADNILADGPDAEIEALHDKYSDISREQLRREELEVVESALGEIFGADAVRGHEASDIDQLLRHASRNAAEQAAAAEQRRSERAAKAAARRGRPTKAELAAERKLQAEREASQSVREIFRRLASALHPDREPDSAKRDHKTELMQRANRAYERSDLLELLSLQIEIEQIDAAHLAHAPEARIIHFNSVLRKQSQALDVEIAERVAPFRVYLGMSAGRITPANVDKALTERIFEAQAICREIARDLESLDDRTRRRAVLETLPDPDDEPDDFLALAMLLDAGIRSTAREPRPEHRKKKPSRSKRARM